MKTHYDWSSRKKNDKEFSRTICGMKDPFFKLSLVSKVDEVTCKRCLNILNKQP